MCWAPFRQGRLPGGGVQELDSKDKWHNPARTQEGRPGGAWGGASGRREREEVGMGSMLDPGAVGTEWAA